VLFAYLNIKVPYLLVTVTGSKCCTVSSNIICTSELASPLVSVPVPRLIIIPAVVKETPGPVSPTFNSITLSLICNVSDWTVVKSPCTSKLPVTTTLPAPEPVSSVIVPA